MMFAGIAAVRAAEVPEGIAVLSVDREAHCESAGHRKIHRAAHAHVVVIPILCLRPAADADEGWIYLLDENRTTGGVLARECPLRATQDLHTRNIIIRLIGQHSARCDRRPVSIDQDTCRNLLSEVALTNAANVDQGTCTGILNVQ